MVMSKALSAIQLSLSNKVLLEIVMDLANADVKIEDEDHALLLVCSLPEAYDSFVYTVLYGRTSITLEDVTASLNSKKLQKNVMEHYRGKSEGLVARVDRVRRGLVAGASQGAESRFAGAATRKAIS
ncbi:hypothetical protein CRG98_034080 [Punica granatum]|uniref:Retrovirus-related Pol polyprotein from transposon TNT 1-94 n=1 Tax=Punica granatum TaxID=22663 RepID=A0A2I0INH8_PUNGR|nr:hypothetical protein CRG98_034080 [Punica granatum]